ncbi:putative extracellular glycosidase [Golovinomyces cichoracearum]|uniref:Crh-like protein n=1 Tax=Golovinomyces cichoracearum TaxID=62708 RepID=A0A420IGZ9_9PEZI|nr:putative extracellular glycosidase [Golovinomyces cichoracearum]
MLFLSLLSALSFFTTRSLAQTWTQCNPMNKTCPNNPALGTSHNFVLNTSSIVTRYFNVTSGILRYGTGNADFTVAKRGDSPTIQSEFFIMFGTVSVIMRAASGQGIISSIVLESEDLDEVDWEFLGGNGTHVESNYFGKGNITSFDRAIYHPVSFDPRVDFHNYSIHWSSDRIEWWIDSSLVRTLPYEAANNGYNFPQTPMNVRLGIWAAGDKKNSPGTIEWAGGLTDYSKGPYSMEVQSTEITDFGIGKEYEWTDKSGSWQSIKSIPGNSTALKAILKEQEPPTPSLLDKFFALSPNTKLSIYCGIGSAAALLFSALIFVCYRARRKGRQELKAYTARMEKEREEASQYHGKPVTKSLNSWDEGSRQESSCESLKQRENSEYHAGNTSADANSFNAGSHGSKAVSNMQTPNTIQQGTN